MSSTFTKVAEAEQIGVETAARQGSLDPRPARVRTALVGFDLVTTVAFLWLMHDGGGHAVMPSGEWGGPVAIGGAVILTMLALGAIGAYDTASRRPGSRLRVCAHLALLGCAAAVVAGLGSSGFQGNLNGDSLLLVALGLPAAWIVARIAVGAVERRRPTRALIVGTGSTAKHVWELSLRHPECGFEVLGFVDDEPLDVSPEAPPALGGIADLPRLVAEHDIEQVIVAYANAVDAALLGVLRALDGHVRIQVVPRLFDLVHGGGLELGRLSLLDAGGVEPSVGERMVKRAFDLVGGIALLVLLTPLLIAVAIAIKCDDRGPVFFRQRRVGKDCRVFLMLKFRTMAVGTEPLAQKLVEGLPIEDAVRELKLRSVAMHVTRAGRRLRATSLDELPQLWNVIRGDMGLVGPRPMPEFEAAELTPWQTAARHAIRPGITGLWQVSGRSSISWEERVHLDCVYARHWSVTSDLRILARTVAVVARRSDAV